MIIEISNEVLEYSQVTCDEMTEEEAAHKIQGMYRTISARSHLRQACRNIYRIIRDKSTGKKYYFNKRKYFTAACCHQSGTYATLMYSDGRDNLETPYSVRP